MPPIALGYKSMVADEFIVKDKNKTLKYKLIFNKNYCEFITLPVPSLFNIFSGIYLVLPEAIHAYRSQMSDVEPEPPYDPHRQSVYQWDPEEIAKQWHPEAQSQYDPSYDFGYLPGQPWP